MDGLSIRRIATKLNIAVTTVHEDLKHERTELTQDALDEIASHKATLIAREEAIIETHWPLREVPESAKVIQASNKMIAQLSGALIVRSEVSGPNGGAIEMQNTSDEILRRLARIADADAPGEGDPKPDGG